MWMLIHRASNAWMRLTIVKTAVAYLCRVLRCSCPCWDQSLRSTVRDAVVPGCHRFDVGDVDSLHCTSTTTPTSTIRRPLSYRHIPTSSSSSSLITHTVAYVGSMFESVCLFVCLSAAYKLKNEWSQSVQTWYREWPWDILEVMWFWSWKVSRRSRLGLGLTAIWRLSSYYMSAFCF